MQSCELVLLTAYEGWEVQKQMSFLNLFLLFQYNICPQAKICLKLINIIYDQNNFLTISGIQFSWIGVDDFMPNLVICLQSHGRNPSSSKDFFLIPLILIFRIF